MNPTIPTASSTKLHIYEACPYRAKLAFIDKSPEPVDPNSPMLRGTQIHEDIEHFVRGDRADPPAACGQFQDLFERLREKLATEPSRVLVEEYWLFDDAWLPTDDRQAFRFVAKLDYFEFEGDDTAAIYDVKTGKRDYNIVKHTDQLIAYAISAFMRFEQLEEIFCQDLYVDHGTTLEKTLTRTKAMALLPQLNTRIDRMLNDTVHRPRPSKSNCAYCPFKDGPIGRNGVVGTGACGLNPE